MGTTVRTANTIVREATPTDAEAVASIGSSAFPKTYEGIIPAASIAAVVEQTYSVDSVSACIEACARDPDSHFLIGERAGTVIGYLHYDAFGSEPELHRIYVDPQTIGGGMGGMLLDELHRRLQPGTSYILMVGSNVGAIRFYKRHGLVEDHEVDGVDFYREHMGVVFPPGAKSVPCLVMRYTKP